MSLAIVFGTTFALFDFLFTETEQPWWQKLLTVVAILFVYDFAYYAGHRTMHHPALFKRVHGIHHRARNPSSVESFYQHPAELVVGLSLFFGTTVLMRLVLGPIHVHTFALLFFLYSQLNILNHAGLRTGIRALGWLDWLSSIHHVHHHDDPNKNFATITMLPDRLFGTLQTWRGR
jgi:sterol desaturase/sphingolipid hydroxylase (fatty acid hydroxylase superfamily)